VAGISAMFDDDVIAPIPGGKIAQNKAELVAAMRANPANAAAKASWTPVKAGISADGQQGFTLGYVTIADAGKPEPRLQKYLAYWAKRATGWRIIAYKREPRPAGAVSTAMIAPSIPARLGPGAMAGSGSDREKELAGTESQFADMARTVGMGSALRKYAAADSISLGSEPEVTVGIDKMARLDLPAPARWSADGARVAASGDLGFTWGISRVDGPLPPGQQAAGQPPAAGPQSTVFPFFAVWRRSGPDDGWRVIAR
jgi:ketosteroid isomerase-like protein